MTNLRIHPEVEGEIVDAATWYREIDPDLAERFVNDVYAMMERAREAPLHYRTIYRHYRRVLCREFPYRIIFEIEEEFQGIQIVAVMHQSRHPDAWKERI